MAREVTIAMREEKEEVSGGGWGKKEVIGERGGERSGRRVPLSLSLG